MERTDSARQLGLWIRQRRLGRGLTQRVLAELSGLSSRWLVDIENGRHLPSFADLLRLVDVLDADLAEAPGVRRSRPAPDARKLAAEEGAETKRREFLGWMATVAGSAAVVDMERLASPTVDGVWLRDAQTISMGLAAQREAVEAAVLLPAVLGHLAALESRLPYSADLTAKTALLAGDLLLGYRRPIGERTRQRLGDAYRCFVLAESLGGPALVAKTMNSRAALHDQRGDQRQALAFQDEAVIGAERMARTSLPWMLARRAELHAKAGADMAAMRDLDRAETALNGPEEWWSMGPRGTVELAAYRGAVVSTLGRHQEAADTLTWVLERMDPGKVMWRAAVAADRDAALAQL